MVRICRSGCHCTSNLKLSYLGQTCNLCYCYSITIYAKILNVPIIGSLHMMHTAVLCFLSHSSQIHK